MKRWRDGTVIFADGSAAMLAWHGGGPSAATLGLIVLVVSVPVLAAVLIVLLIGGSRSVLHRRRRSDGRLQAATELEARARACMGELCPHGWRAQATLFAPGDELPPGAPSGPRSQVALDWAELDDGDGVAIVRRVWAPTLVEALEAMVEDRRTDETLERIERGASIWPEG